MRAAAAALLTLAALAVAGCGGGTKSNGEATKTPAQVLRDVKQAAAGASSVHVAGTIVSSGQSIGLDLTMVRGKGGKGTLRLGTLSIDLVRLGGKAYIRGSDAFYTKFAGAAAAQLLHGKWLEGSATSGNFTAFVGLTDIDKLIHQLVTGHGTATNAGETTYKGEKAVALNDKTQGGTLYIAATGSPLPLAIVGTKTGHTGTVTFTDWNANATVTAPAGAIDLSKLGSG